MFRKPADMFDRDREWDVLSRFVGSGVDGATLGIVSGRRRGRGRVVNDPEERKSREVDVVAIDDEDDRKILALGEAKWNVVMGIEHIRRLRRIAELLKRSGRFNIDAVRYVCFSGKGFDAELRAAAEAREVVLVDIEDLYA